MDIEEHRKTALADCDRVEVIDEAAHEVANALMNGKPIEIAFAPGNGTRYAYLFSGCDTGKRVDLGGGLESASCGEGSVWLCVLNGPATVYPLSLVGRQAEMAHPSYLADKWNDGRLSDDVFVLERLLAGVMRLTQPNREANGL